MKLKPQKKVNLFCFEIWHVTWKPAIPRFSNPACCERYLNGNDTILKQFYVIPSMLWEAWKQYGIFDFQSLEILVLFACSPEIQNYNNKS